MVPGAAQVPRDAALGLWTETERGSGRCAPGRGWHGHDDAGSRVTRDPAPVRTAARAGAACQARADRRTWSSQARRAVSAASASAIRLSSPADRAASRSFSSSEIESSS